MKPLLAALYVRISTPEKGQNPDKQLSNLREYAGSRGFKIYQEYVDYGAFRGRERRTALDEMMAAAKRKEFDVVLVFKLARFAKSLRHLISTLEAFRQWGTGFISYTEQFDTSSSMGQVMFKVMAEVAQFQRDILSERIKAGMEGAQSRGRNPGRPKVEIDIEKVK